MSAASISGSASGSAALVVARGCPRARTSAVATGASGTRTPTCRWRVSAVRGTSLVASSTMVYGPGNSRRMRRKLSLETMAYFATWPRSAQRNANGFFSSRRFKRARRSIAFFWNASQPHLWCGSGLLLAATAAFQVPHLVQPAFLLLRSLAGHPLPLLDQLADLLPALVTDLGVELRTARGTDGLAALLADLLVELVPALRLHRLAALAADLFVERTAALLGDFYAAFASGLGHGHSALLLLRHFPASGGWKEPPSRPPSAPSVFKKRIRGCASFPAR